MYAQAVRIPPVHLRGKRIQSSAFAQCAKGCAFPDVQLDCIKYLKLGECKAAAVPMKSFTVNDGGEEKSIMDVPWIQPAMKAKLDTDKEIFIRVEWKSYVNDERDGFWEKGMTSIPMVAYKLNDQSTHKKVREHFGYKD